MASPKRITFVIPSSFRGRFNLVTSALGLTLLERLSHFVFYNAGTLLLASIMKQRGHDVRLCFDGGDRIDREAIDADVICISVTTAAATRGYEIARAFAHRKVIIGGPHASALPHEAAKHAAHVVIGEGEKVLPRIVDGEITDRIVNAGLIDDLDSLPYLDFTLLPFKPINFPVITSRGCPFDCTFCAVTKMFGRKVRERSPHSILAEVKHYARTYGALKRLDLISPNFTIRKQHCKETLRLLIAEGITPALEIRTSTHVTEDPEIPKLLAKFPVVSVLVGAESLETAHVEYYKKRRKKGELEHFVEVMKGHGLKPCLSMIWGSKLDSPDSMRRMLDGVYDLRPSHFQIGILTPFPGTELYREVAGDIFIKDWRFYDLMHVTHLHPTMDPYTMQTTWLEAQREMWSLTNMIKRRVEIFSPPINKLFFAALTMGAESEFSEFLDSLRAFGSQTATSATPAVGGTEGSVVLHHDQSRRFGT